MKPSSASTRRSILGGYFLSLTDKEGKRRFSDNLIEIGGFDPYKSKRKEWQDDEDL